MSRGRTARHLALPRLAEWPQWDALQPLVGYRFVRAEWHSARVSEPRLEVSIQPCPAGRFAYPSLLWLRSTGAGELCDGDGGQIHLLAHGRLGPPGCHTKLPVLLARPVQN